MNFNKQQLRAIYADAGWYNKTKLKMLFNGYAKSEISIHVKNNQGEIR